MTLAACSLLLTLQTGPRLPGPDSYQPKGPTIEFRLESGDKFQILTDPKLSPKTVGHIIALVKQGFYDRQRFHRVESWVTQWGAPQSKTMPLDVKNPKTGKMEPSEVIGEGGSGKDIPVFEPGTDVDFYRGIVGIASTGFQVPGDSQLFILKRDTLRLYGSYAIVGKVTQGMSVVDGIKRGDRIQSARVR